MFVPLRHDPSTFVPLLCTTQADCSGVKRDWSLLLVNAPSRSRRRGRPVSTSKPRSEFALGGVSSVHGSEVRQAPAGGGCGIRTHGGFPRALSRRMHSATMRTLHGVSPRQGTAASAHHPTPMHPRPSRRRASRRRAAQETGSVRAPAGSRPPDRRPVGRRSGVDEWRCSGPDGSVPSAVGRRRRPRLSSTRCRRSRCRGAHPPGAGGLEPPPPRRRCAEPPGPRRCGGSHHWP